MIDLIKISSHLHISDSSSSSNEGLNLDEGSINFSKVFKILMEIGKEIMTSVASEIGAGEVSTDDSVGRVSVIGAGMASNPGVAATIFETLSSESINIHMISTSAIRVSCVVNKADIEKATNILHHAFELDKG